MKDDALAPTLPAAPRCPRCGAPRHPDRLGGLCPRCLARGAVKVASEPPPSSSSRRFGHYEMRGLLGKGGMGEVHRAYQVLAEREVALKRLRAPAFVTDEDRRRFRDEIRAVARISHPNIVPVYDVGEHDGEAFFTMELMPGGPLRARMDRYRDPHRAAALVATLARAVHEAHEKHLIHRDLKPENVLFDDRDEPHVADFGVAKHVDQSGRTESNLLIGTPGYMSPEQARGQGRHVTRAADVWALGVLLYELVAGVSPFLAPTPGETLQRTLTKDPDPLRRVRRGVGRDLDAVCMACLEKDPAWRYPTAAALADDLDRWLAHQPVQIRRPSLVERARRAVTRHPVIAAAAVALVAFAIVATSVAFAQARARRREVLQTNTYAARAVAAAVRGQLFGYADTVAAAARAPAFVARFEADDRPGLEAACADLLAPRPGEGSAFDSCFVIDTTGTLKQGAPTAHFPAVPGQYYARRFAFRDYVRGALAVRPTARHAAYVSRAIHSSGDGRYKFTIAAPVRSPGGATAGVLVATIVTDVHLGRQDLNDQRRTVVIADRLDRDGPGEALPDDYVALAGDGVKQGEKVVVKSAAFDKLAALRARAGDRPSEPLDVPPSSWVADDADYRDPPSMRPPDGYAGPWLAGVAPIGDTELVVLVKTRADDAVALDHGWLRAFLAWLAGGLGLLGAAWLLARRRASSPPP